MSQTEHMQEFMTRPGKGLFQESGQLKRPYSYKIEQNIQRTSVPLKKIIHEYSFSTLGPAGTPFNPVVARHSI